MESTSVDAAQEHLLRLPFEGREEIADHLSIPDAKSLSLVCQAIRDACLRRLFSEIYCGETTCTFDWSQLPQYYSGPDLKAASNRRVELLLPEPILGCALFPTRLCGSSGPQRFHKGSSITSISTVTSSPRCI
jgi:hypothetical protein